MKHRQKEIDEVFIKNILLFYKEKGRHDLVWRKKITPYKILVSEIMLQQTQVSRVLAKYNDWMKLYPTLLSLRKASLQEILVLWQGLGYQRRAKALYEIAKNYRELPKNYDELLTLPGIGKYTASALSAFAYNEFSYPMLETNIRTVMIDEFLHGENEIHDGQLYDHLDRLATYKEVKDVGARVWYYALMDYGAHLKENKISHNSKSVHYTKHSVYKGSLRELRAKTLFAITHDEKLPSDMRLEKVLELLIKEGYVVKKGKRYRIIS
jgi:A/G-specific adenine glycosylase